jgi:hypothetical protein
MTPFSQRVTTPGWRDDAERWIAEQLAAAGLAVTGPLEQPRVRPWSTQLVVPTDGGTVWFKANCRAQGFEPRLQALLSRFAPGAVDAPLAFDGDRAWMLTRDRGATLGDSRAPTLDDWRRVVRAWATLQCQVAAHGREVLDAGVPDCSPATVPARLEEMITALAGLPDDHPAHLTAELADRLEEARPLVAAAARTLGDSPLPASLQHGDLHPWNVFTVDGDLRVFDFGDAQWAHPLESLCIPWAITREDGAAPWPELLAAYREPWAELLTFDELGDLMAAAAVTQPVNRSFTWWECLAQATEDEWREWGEAPVRHLSNVLEPWPA